MAAPASTYVRDWRKLDAAHRRRGELITVVFCPEGAGAFAPPPRTGKVGTPRTYSDELIESLLMVKVLLGLPLRAVEGFARGMARMAQAEWPIPNYSTLCRRQAKLDVSLPAPRVEGRRRILMVDSTGLKVFGEGEWKVRQHGWDKRRTWRKAHLLVDRESGHVIAVELTDKDTADCLVLPALLPDKLDNTAVLGDGAYHTRGLHREVHRRGGRLLAPPPRNAQTWREWGRREEAAFAWRNAQLTPLQRLGRTEWKIRSGCSKRSYVESMMHRLKALTGDRLAARSFERQQVEVRLRCKVLNATATSTMKVAA